MQMIEEINNNEEKLSVRLESLDYQKEITEIIKKMLKWNPDERIKLEKLYEEEDNLGGTIFLKKPMW